MKTHPIRTSLGILAFVVVGAMTLAILPDVTASVAPTAPTHHTLTPKEYVASLTPQQRNVLFVGEQIARTHPYLRPVVNDKPGGIRLDLSVTGGKFIYVHFSHDDLLTGLYVLGASGSAYAVLAIVGLVTVVNPYAGAALSIMLGVDGVEFWYLATLTVNQVVHNVMAWWCGAAGNFIYPQGCTSTVPGQVGAPYLVWVGILITPTGYQWRVDVKWTGLTADLDWIPPFALDGWNLDWPACPC